MSAQLDALKSAVADLQTTASAIVGRLETPVADDSADLEALTSTVASVNSQLGAALNPPAPEPAPEQPAA